MRQKLTRLCNFRLDREDERTLRRLSEKLKLKRSDVTRMAIRRMAEAEGVSEQKQSA